jgi:predicted Zn finger-like uncharacterized protein
MKFVCERCHTKYSIADDKVRQKILKIRCKTCENVITVRDQSVSASDPGAASAPGAVAAGEWHLAVNGDEAGPFDLPTVAKKILALGPDDDAHVWRADFDGWKAPKDVPALAAELQRLRGSGPKPPPPPARPLSKGAVPAVTGAGGSGALAAAPRPSSSMPAVKATGPAAGLGAKESSAAARPVALSSMKAAAKPAGAAPAAKAAPAASPDVPTYTGFGDEDDGDRTQIQPLDAALLMAAGGAAAGGAAATDALPDAAEAAPAAARAPGLTGPRPSSGALAAVASDEAAAAVEEPPAAGASPPAELAAPSAPRLSALDFLPSVAPPAGGTPSLFPPTSPAPPAAGGSQLSQLKGLPGFFGRYPALKFVVAGGVLVTLVIVVVVLTIAGDSSKKVANAAKEATRAQPTPAVDPEEVARAEAEARFRNSVGDPASAANVPRAGRPDPNQQRRAAPAPRPVVKAPSAPAVEPPAIGTAPPPLEAAPGSPNSAALAVRETRVGPATPRASAAAPGGATADVDFFGFVRRKENQATLKTCYDRALKRNEALRMGKLNVTVDVGRSGTVKGVKVDAPSEFEGVGTCIQDAVRRWRWPASSEDYQGTFPLVLQGSS